MSSAVSKSCVRFDEPVIVKILSGEHFSHESVQALTRVVAGFFCSFEIQKVKEEELHFKELGKRKILLVFPGASDLKQINLSTKQQEEINLYALGGMIKVLAVCAGAFFASETIIYDTQKRHEGKKLSLFKGACCGPAFESQDPKWIISAQQLSLESQRGNTGYGTMIGGGFFAPSSKLMENRDYCVISRYVSLPGTPIAALTCLPGVDEEFNVALVGPHLEYEATDESFFFLKKAFPDKGPLVDTITTHLSQSCLFRKDFFHVIFSRLGFR